MEDKRMISKERGETIAREHGIRFLETSAKANINIDRAFMELAEAILKKVLYFHLINPELNPSLHSFLSFSSKLPVRIHLIIQIESMSQDKILKLVPNAVIYRIALNLIDPSFCNQNHSLDFHQFVSI